VYLYACAVLLGAEVASAWSRPPSPSPEPFFTQLRRVVRDLFVQRERPAGLP
jgi:hypothetical protein